MWGCNHGYTMLPGHQPEMPDYVKLFLSDAMCHGFFTYCILKSIDWRFLCQNFINLGQVVWILHDFQEKTSFQPLTTFSLEMKELHIFTMLSYCNILKQRHKIGLEWNINWQTYETISNYLSFWTIPVFLAQSVQKKLQNWKCTLSWFVSKILMLRES